MVGLLNQKDANHRLTHANRVYKYNKLKMTSHSLAHANKSYEDNS